MADNRSDNDIECIFEGPSSSSSQPRGSVQISKPITLSNSPTGSDSSICILNDSDPLITGSSSCCVPSGLIPNVELEKDEKWMQLDFIASTPDVLSTRQQIEHSFSFTENICDVPLSFDDDQELDAEPALEEDGSPKEEILPEVLQRKSPREKIRQQERQSVLKRRSCSESPAKVLEIANVRRSKQPKILTNDEEKDEARREKDAKKVEKELLAAKKKEAKEIKEKERLAKKLQKESEKLEKAAFKEARKPLQGGKSSLESLKVFVSKVMLTTIGRDEFMTSVLEECDVFNMEELDVEGEDALVIRWSRSHITAFVEKSSTSASMKRTEERTEERDLLIQIPKKEFIAMVDFHKQSVTGEPFDDHDRDSFNTFIHRYKEKYPEKILHFFVSGMEGYFRKQLNDNIYGDAKRARARAPRRSLLDIPYRISFDDVEMAMIDVMCRFNIRIVQTNSAKEFARLLLTTHKAIAERVVKELKDQSLDTFDAISANIKTSGVTVSDDNPESFRELWIRQLEQFTLVSRDVAITVANLYPSPRLLMAAYAGCTTEKDKERLFESVMIKRGTDRRMGPKMSKLLYRFMNSDDGQEMLE